MLTLRASTFALLASLCLMTTGCAKKPTMQLNYAEISGVSLGFPPQLSVVLTSVLDVHNPNGYDVAVRAVRGTLFVANRYTVPIDFRADNPGIWLASKRHTQLRVPVAIPIDVALALAGESMTQQVIPFRFTGKADVTATQTFKIEKDDYSVSEVGTFSAQQLQVTLGNMGIGLGGVTPR